MKFCKIHLNSKGTLLLNWEWIRWPFATNVRIKKVNKAKCILTPDLWSTVHRCHLWIPDFLLCLRASFSQTVNIPPKGHKCQIKDLPLEIWKWPARTPGTASLHIFSAPEHIFLHFFKTLKQLSPSAERRGKKDFFSKNPRVSVAALLESWISLQGKLSWSKSSVQSMK